MTVHAMEEMAEDFLDIVDVEKAILNGRLARIDKNDPRGTAYVVEGTAADGTTAVGVVGRFTSIDSYFIVPIYEITEFEG